MAILHARTPLTQAERHAKRRLVLQDTLALLGLFAITAVLAVLTYLLFQSYSQHQKDAAARWLRRGENALHSGHPEQAIYALRSALAYVPSRGTEIELAEALAQSGHYQEAAAYFNALWEAEPGNGLINLQLARLALVNKHVSKAMEYYHAAIFGTWEGDGAVRRREVRLEMVGHLIQLARFAEARNELLVAAGNANDTDVQDRLEIAGLLLAAHAPTDALRLYRDVAGHRPAPFAALEGAGRTAFLLGRYREAQHYLQRALATAAATPSVENGTSIDRSELEITTRLLNLYPSEMLPAATRAERVLEDRVIAGKRLQACAAALSVPPTPPPAPGNSPQPTQSATRGPGSGLNPPGSPPPVAAPPQPNTGQGQPAPSAAAGGAATSLQTLQSELASQPKRLDVPMLLNDPSLEQTLIQWIYDTEQATAAVCGAPSGDDALLLRMAQTPDAVDQQ